MSTNHLIQSSRLIFDAITFCTITTITLYHFDNGISYTDKRTYLIYLFEYLGTFSFQYSYIKMYIVYSKLSAAHDTRV